MHMLDWNTYRQQLVAAVGELGKLNSDIVKGYITLSRAGQHGAYRGRPGKGSNEGRDH